MVYCYSAYLHRDWRIKTHHDGNVHLMTGIWRTISAGLPLVSGWYFSNWLMFSDDEDDQLGFGLDNRVGWGHLVGWTTQETVSETRKMCQRYYLDKISALLSSAISRNTSSNISEINYNTNSKLTIVLVQQNLLLWVFVSNRVWPTRVGSVSLAVVGGY